MLLGPFNCDMFIIPSVNLALSWGKNGRGIDRIGKSPLLAVAHFFIGTGNLSPSSGITDLILVTVNMDYYHTKAYDVPYS